MSQSIRRALYRAKGLPDPGPSPSMMLTELRILVETPLAKAIDELHEMVSKEMPSRNDYLVELLKEGLRGAAEAGIEAQRELAERQHPDHVEPRPSIEITNPGIPAEERDAISSRLRSLRGEDLAPAAAYGERDEVPF
jgi:hypothetical protein